MKKNAKGILWLIALTASLLMFTACPGSVGGNDNNQSGGSSSTISVDMGDFTPGSTSLEQAANMAIGWNLGNTLDSGSTGSKSNMGTGTETSWGMPKTTQKMIKAVKAAGFKTIRIPVSWHNHITDGTNYTIDSAWMNRVKTIVDWAIDEGMCVIINIHHDNMAISALDSNYGYALSDDSEIQATSKKYISKVWTQIATTFADYDNHLVFEILNEPRDISGEWKGNEWWTNSSAVINVITAYEQAGLDAIRATGGNNADRFVMTPGYAGSGSDSGMLGLYKMPTDTASDRLLLSAHAYSPYNFAMNNMDDTTFDSDDAASLTSLFSYLNNNYIKKGIGVVMGEASASDKNNTDERIKWAKDYYKKAANIGIPVVLWDNMVLYASSKDPAESHGYLDRNKCTWYFPEIITTMMETVYGDKYTGEDSGDSGNTEDNPSESGDGDNSGEDNSNTENLLSEDLVLDSWSINTTISSANFASATDSTKIVFTYEKISGSDYVNLKLQDGGWSVVFTDGEIEGASKDDGVLVPSSTSGTISYTPTSSEWSTIKSKGLIVYGYGLKITKITLN